jgi:hypothetical protein
MKDYYKILEISPKASINEIKEQYRFLIQAWHPDKFVNPAQKAKAEEKTKEINEAYTILNNPNKRSEYDRSNGSNSTDFHSHEKEQQRSHAAEYDQKAQQEREQRARENAERQQAEYQQQEKERREKEEVKNKERQHNLQRFKSIVSIATIIGICITVITLILVLGQWLNPRTAIEAPVLTMTAYPISTPTSIDKDSLLGSWNYELNWNCEAGHGSGQLIFDPIQVTMINPNVSSPYNAIWTLSGNEIRFTIDAKAVYVGTVTSNQITGTMSGPLCTGSWLATKN